MRDCGTLPFNRAIYWGGAPPFDASESCILLDPADTSDADTYSVVAIDAANGSVLDSNLIGVGYESDTLQLSPTIVPGRVMYQGTITGVDRIAP